MAEIILKPEREKSILRRHPWIFSGAVDRIKGNPQMGETVTVLDSRNKFLAKAAYSPNSQIRARVWTLDEGESIDSDFFRRKISGAISLRVGLGMITEGTNVPVDEQPFNSVRLIHAESDLLPGLIVDKYAGVLVLQSLTAGSEIWRETIADILQELTGISDIYERSDVDVRELEGLPSRKGILKGKPETRMVIREAGLKFAVDISTGHKTGFYLDQRENRQIVGLMAGGMDVLNCFCYTGGFGIHAIHAGAKSVISIDSSATALELAKENTLLNNCTENVEWREDDVFQALRKFRDERRTFDLIILDPPKFASSFSQAEKASRAYKDINLLAFKLLRPGGKLVTFSCSGGIDANLFQKIVAGAALDAGVEAGIVKHLAQGGDHPVSLHFPERAYLKGLICVKRS